MLGPECCLTLLILIVEFGTERMMRVMHFVDEISDRELELVRPEAGSLFLWCQSVFCAQEVQDGSRPTNQLRAVL